VPGRINGFSLAYTATGAIVLWSGIRGWTISDTFRNLLAGKTPAASTEQISTTLATSQAQALTGAGQSLPGVTSGIPAGVAAGTPAANKALGLLMAGAYGWAGSDQWPYLESGWQEESGWNQYAAYDASDPYDHAYGIPQANPGTKMASAGPNWKTDAATQIRWGLAYIKGTYGAPSKVPGWSPNGPVPGYVGY